ncbi:hypothetical protein BD408DRAFT_438022, partial [Parasitella parasitica]
NGQNSSSVAVFDTSSYLLQQLHPTDLAQAAGLINPVGDGNCGFRAVSVAVYGDEERWVEVKQKLLATLRSYQHVYTTYGLDLEEFEKKLGDVKAPCMLPNEQYMWFDTFGCPQLVADTFSRPVVLLGSSARSFPGKGTELDSQGNVVYNKSRMTFVPFFSLDPNVICDPIILFLTDDHFYLLELKASEKSKTKVFEHWPPVNPMHLTIMENHRDICPAQ